MRFRAFSLSSQARRQFPSRSGRDTLFVIALLILLLIMLSPHSAAARTAPRRDRRSDREVPVTYTRIQTPNRQVSGFVVPERREAPPPSDEPANSAESTRPLSNKNDDQPPVRGTNLRLVR